MQLRPHGSSPDSLRDLTITNPDGQSVTRTNIINITGGANFTLTAALAGTGTGTVTSAPAGINCPGDCTEDYASGTTVVLTAAPTGGSTFTGWSGGGCSGTGTCTLTVLAATTVTATFTAPVFTLTAALAGTGTGTVTSGPSRQASIAPATAPRTIRLAPPLC